MRQTGVLIMCYGSPASLEHLEAFYTDIRRGRPPTHEQLADLAARYQAIGGVSPLSARTEAQVSGLQKALDQRHPGSFLVFSGAKHSSPTIEQSVHSMAEAGLGKAVGLVLAPHYSRLSVGEYVERATSAARLSGLELTCIESWHLERGFIELLADRLAHAWSRIDPEKQGRAATVFTAHSLPARILDDDDPYPRQLGQTASAVADLSGVERWQVAWQSAGRTGEAWLGPDVKEAIADLARQGAKAVVVCPAGFTADHLEVLYDIDIDAKGFADGLGLDLLRTDSLNDDARFMEVLAGLVSATCAA